MILTICIPTLPDLRSREHLQNLKKILTPQLNDDVELIEDDRPKNIPTGTKRNDMYQRAIGQYVCSVDCDDEISSVYVSEILKYIKGFDGHTPFPACVTFEGWMTTNGRDRVDWIIRLGEKYEARKDSDNVTRYYRFPNHLCPIKREIATRVKFGNVWQGEDYQFAKYINDKGLLRTSNHIPLKLYHYKYMTKK